MNELTVVRLNEPVTLDDGTVLPKDTTGTIVSVLNAGAYMVEFVDHRGHTLGTAIVSKTAVRYAKSPDRL